METHLADWLKGTRDGDEAEAILRKCVHCGFCTATCPTYQLLGDELDGPRGRIYLIKSVVEGEKPTASTMDHLDRCLTCRNCESTCPSGVDYGHLVDIGRKLVEQQVERPASQRFMRTLLRETLTRRWLFDPAMRVGQAVRPLLPEALKAKVPGRRDPGPLPARAHARKVILLDGCVQPAMMPSIDAATDRVLDRLGVQAVRPAGSGCCGAIRHHLNDQSGARQDARRNIAAWWPLIEAGAEAILINASGCGAMVKDYAHLLADDPEWAPRAQRVVELTRDLAEWLPAALDEAITGGRLRAASAQRVVFHPPCTLQHGQKVRGVVEALLSRIGATVLPVGESHLCCGSAGTYSVLQPELSTQLRERKLGNLSAGKPDLILSANIGCITHLQAGTGTSVRHWIEWLDEQMAEA
ncbi:MAG: glycolate oxidase iron-sulfur subunit [Betaproteobacteria bacterium]|nr:glycolate oxidase iron-sulfur subunit [Betaproteobacteria bacterium]